MCYTENNFCFRNFFIIEKEFMRLRPYKLFLACKNIIYLVHAHKKYVLGYTKGITVMQKGVKITMRRGISIVNDDINTILDNSSNPSKLIEESMIYFMYAVTHNLLSDTELNRLFKTGLIKIRK